MFQLYRHGDRSPVFIYPRDPYSIDTWSQGLGWLSEVMLLPSFLSFIIHTFFSFLFRVPSTVAKLRGM